MWDIWDVGCLGCGMFGMWDVRDVGCSECVMFRMFGMWDVWDVGCLECGVFGVWDVGCGTFAGMWDVDLQNTLLNLINDKRDIDKICLYAKDPYEAKYKLLVNKRESTDLKCLNDSKAFIEYSNDIDDIYKNIEDYNPNKKRKILIASMIWLLLCLVIKNLIQW